MYEECLAFELRVSGIQFERQKSIPIVYKGVTLASVYRVDFVVNGNLVLELKSVEGLLPVHAAQLLTYLRIGGWCIGLLVNFNTPLLKDGIKRIVQTFQRTLFGRTLDHTVNRIPFRAKPQLHLNAECGPPRPRDSALKSVPDFLSCLEARFCRIGQDMPEEQHKPKPEKKTKKAEDPLKDIVALAKRRGFVYPGSDIYGGLANTFDYGPNGTELLRNIKDMWWRAFVREREDVVGLDSSILLHPDVWKASGHVDSFNDPLVDCKQCRSRFRADHIVEQIAPGSPVMSLAQLQDWFVKNEIQCPTCGTKNSFTPPRQFNLMFETKTGSVSGSDMTVYLRPETAQGIFINFKNIVDTCRVKVPFGVAQIGKSFRNEIVARQFVFRTSEFEQMEMEFFCAPGTQAEWFEHWVQYCMDFLLRIGLKKDNLRIRRHEPEELAFYSEGTVDIEYKFPFGWGEIWGIASRTDYDLKRHAEFSGKNLDYHDADRNEKYIPYVVEPALGLNRLMLAVMCDAYYVENEGTPEIRTVLGLSPVLAPIKVGIFPLIKKDGLAEIARDIHKILSKHFQVEYDHSGNIGKRYYRQDELGTPFCVTVDYETKDNNTVTLRERDSTKQERIKIEDLAGVLREKLIL